MLLRVHLLVDNFFIHEIFGFELMQRFPNFFPVVDVGMEIIWC